MSGEGPGPDFLRTCSDEIDAQVVRRSKSYMGGPEKVRAAGTRAGPDLPRTLAVQGPGKVRSQTFSGLFPDFVRHFGLPRRTKV